MVHKKALSASFRRHATHPDEHVNTPATPAPAAAVAPSVVSRASFGERLRLERARLGLSQADFATAGGVKRATQHFYEQDVRTPDVRYLESIRAVGADIEYLILGRRAPSPSTETVTLKYEVIANAYRAVEEFAEDDFGHKWPLESRVRLMVMVCHLGRNGEQVDLQQLRTELARLPRSQG